ncbi:hypothetical protein NMY22_g18008 [Coprinellus aureogranulatus]|nr:hypothetical protein NMY22_g18008 [Coprinellus aureogranulatus]
MRRGARRCVIRASSRMRCFAAILDRDTNVFYALTKGNLLMSLDMGLLKTANATALTWNEVQNPQWIPEGAEQTQQEGSGAGMQGYEFPTMALAQNHVHFVGGVPGLKEGEAKIFVIHCRLKRTLILPVFRHVGYYASKEGSGEQFSTNLATLQAAIAGLDINEDPYIVSLRKQLAKLSSASSSASGAAAHSKALETLRFQALFQPGDASPAANTTTTLCQSRESNVIHCERRSTPYAWSYNDLYEPNSPPHAVEGSFDGISRPPSVLPHPPVCRTDHHLKLREDEIPSELFNTIPTTAGVAPLPPWATIPAAVFDAVGNSATSEFTGDRDYPFSAFIDSSPHNESSAQRYLDQCLDANPTPGEDTSPAPIGTTFGIPFRPGFRIEAGPWCPPPELTDELLVERGLSTAERTSIHALAKLSRLKFDYSSPVPIPLDIPRSAKPDDSKTSSASPPTLDGGGVLLETHITPEMQRVRKGLTERMNQNALQAKKGREVIFVNSKVTLPNPPPRMDAPYHPDQDINGSPGSPRNLWRMPEDYDRFFDGLVNKTRANDSLRRDAAVELTAPSAPPPPTSSADWAANPNHFPFAASFDYARSGVYAITPREGHAERDKLPPSLYRYLRLSNNGNEDSGSREATKSARPKRRLWPITQLPR